MSAAEDERLFGWKSIAAALDVSDDTAQRYAELDYDPLPVRQSHRGVYAWAQALRHWGMRRDMPFLTHLELERLRRKVGRWAKKRGTARGRTSKTPGS